VIALDHFDERGFVSVLKTLNEGVLAAGHTAERMPEALL
jgi:hypothetical protein